MNYKLLKNVKSNFTVYGLKNSLSHCKTVENLNFLIPTKLQSGLKLLGVCTVLSLISIPAYACEIPKSYYSNVFCTANSSFFLALKDSGHPVALINKQGKRVIDLTPYSAVDVNKISGGLFPVQKFGRVGYINLSGQMVIPIVYNLVTADKNNLGWARPVKDNRIVVKKSGSLGVIDTRNRVIVPFSINYNKISDFNRGLATVQTKNETYQIDTNGNRIRPEPKPQSTQAKPTQAKPTQVTVAKPTLVASPIEPPTAVLDTRLIPKESLTIENKMTPYSEINTSYPDINTPYPEINTPYPEINTGSVYANSSVLVSTPIITISPIEYPPTLVEGSSLIQYEPVVLNNTSSLNNQYPVLVSTTPALISSPVISSEVRAQAIDAKDNPKPSSMDREIWQPANRDGKWGFINKYGVPMITFSFNKVTQFSEGLAGIQIEDKWGFVNLEGQLVIPLTFKESEINRTTGDINGPKPFIFNKGKAWVSNNASGAKICIDLEGKYTACNF